MKYVDEYRDKALVGKLTGQLRQMNGRRFTFMEVCGGHTHAIHRFGLPSLIPENFRLISGPGCPVCVTGKSFIDKAVFYAGREKSTIATFGDLLRVPGTSSSLEKEKSAGADIRVVFSSMDAVEMARRESSRTIIFLAIGFETTAPGTALAVREATRLGLTNFFILCGHKIMPPAMEAIVKEGVAIDGFICPGHVSAITGSGIYDFLARDYGMACVVTGFEPVDLTQALYMLARQVMEGRPCVEIQYRRAVSREGNLLARKAMEEVFETSDSWWRGLGMIPSSGLVLNSRYSSLDIEKHFPAAIGENESDKGCICGEILRGLKMPPDCRLFRKMCSPENPVGACMVSPEGACQTYYHYSHDD